MISYKFLVALALTTFTFSLSSHAAIKVFACEPEWGALAEELGGKHVDVFVATTGLQDPHRTQARPSLLAQARQADMIICTGADLEIGWLPLLLRQVGNAKIRPGEPGYFMATDYVTVLEVPTQIDLNGGHVHAAGNPHIQTDPRNIGLVATALNVRLQEVDRQQAASYQQRYQDFYQRWQTAIQQWQQQAQSLRGLPIIVSHNNWVYLENWLGLKRITTLEPKPGIPPSSAYLAEVLAQVEKTPVTMILNAAYQDKRAAEWLSQRSKIPVVTLPFTVGGDKAASNLFTLFDDTLQRLLEVKPHE
jgi:zinc/manganese transport system substrate-binding protein